LSLGSREIPLPALGYDANDRAANRWATCRAVVCRALTGIGRATDLREVAGVLLGNGGVSDLVDHSAQLVWAGALLVVGDVHAPGAGSQGWPGRPQERAARPASFTAQ